MEPTMSETGMVLSGDERGSRRVQIARVSVRYPVAGASAGGARVEFVVGDTLDLSRGGIFIKASRPLPLGRLLPFEMRIAAEPLPFTVIGRVVWTRTAADGEEHPGGMGVKFIDMDERAREVVGRLVAVREPTIHGLGPRERRAHGGAPAATAMSVEATPFAHAPVRRPEPSIPFFLVTRKAPRRQASQVHPEELRGSSVDGVRAPPDAVART